MNNKEVKSLDEILEEIESAKAKVPTVTKKQLYHASKRFEKILIEAEREQALQCIARLLLKVL